MERVIIIGCPGSGKSTFARKLRKVVSLPLYHLDMLYWNEDKTTVSRDVFLDRLDAVMNNPLWIIDGNYISSMEKRLSACDTVFFLDYPTRVCLDGIKERKGSMRSDMPWVETGDDEAFIAFVKSFDAETKPIVEELLTKYSHKKIITFHNREESEIYLEKIQKERPE